MFLMIELSSQVFNNCCVHSGTWGYALNRCVHSGTWGYALNRCVHSGTWGYALNRCVHSGTWGYALNRCCVLSGTCGFAFNRCVHSGTWGYALNRCVHSGTWGYALNRCVHSGTWGYALNRCVHSGTWGHGLNRCVHSGTWGYALNRCVHSGTWGHGLNKELGKGKLLGVNEESELKEKPGYRMLEIPSKRNILSNSAAASYQQLSNFRKQMKTACYAFLISCPAGIEDYEEATIHSSLLESLSFPAWPITNQDLGSFGTVLYSLPVLKVLHHVNQD
ncbi:Zinc finger protein 616 [Acipenser ruthenus]|uniref:Zinc finger protein 616 n=1 Tax=Acipenser ruthenus TaxID=7906 RepID=A0A444UG43_ACIRT|nr:Zinc finger protein 616 [Acipenser ruthenus]